MMAEVTMQSATCPTELIHIHTLLISSSRTLTHQWYDLWFDLWAPVVSIYRLSFSTHSNTVTYYFYALTCLQCNNSFQLLKSQHGVISSYLFTHWANSHLQHSSSPCKEGAMLSFPQFLDSSHLLNSLFFRFYEMQSKHDPKCVFHQVLDSLVWSEDLGMTRTHSRNHAHTLICIRFTSWPR